MTTDRRWLAFMVLTLGSFMIVLDTTITNVALPSIRADLGFTATSLAWVVNAYMLFFGGFLLLGGRLGDLYGHRRLFLIGIGLFTVASLLAGLASSQAVLIAARAAQGLGGAIASATGLSLMMTIFTAQADRAKAMGVVGFVSAGGGSVGVLLGGILVSTFGWHSVFLVNIPVGIAVCVLSLRLIDAARGVASGTSLDYGGAITVTASVMIAVYAIVNGNEAGWTSPQTLGLLGLAATIFASFIAIESRTRAPLMPLGLFRQRNLSIANVMGVLWAAAMFAWFFLSALYLQLVLGYSPLQVGLAFLPGNLVMAVFSVSISAKLVMRFGIKPPLGTGLALAGLGLALLVRAPIDGNYLVDVFPSMVLLGLGAGIAFNPMLLVAMTDVRPEQSGLASGLVNTSFMLGGALGLAILASVAAATTNASLGSGATTVVALTDGYHAAFAFGAIFALGAALLGVRALRIAPQPAIAPQEFETTEYAAAAD
ncbi:MAG: MFS transporter [Chloroflexi bacterium]|nr:MAG: MFS transporter [Chloroflexota bacterium]